MLQTGRFTEFVEKLVNKDNEEKEDQRMWEYYLSNHMQFYEGSFSNFREGIKNDRNNSSLSANDIETTIQDSMNILKNFNPE